jgi:signal transduction histidine kinase
VCERATAAQREVAGSRRVDIHVTAVAKPVVLGDGDRILQIVANLITNALTATPVGGEVTIDVKIDPGVGQVIVSDTGPGIPEADRVAILRPFVTSSVRHGIGLGLPVSSELAQAMGGTLVVGDRPGGGAAFTLSLPLAGGSGRTPDPEPESQLVAE